MKKTLLYFVAAILCIFNSCSEDSYNYPINSGEIKPGIVTNVTVENLPAKAKITYTLPDDQDLSYIEATYVIPSTGEENVIKSSAYNNSITVVGFGDTEEQKVILCSVNKSNIKSDPVTVTVKPTENPIWNIFRSLKVTNDFGGFDIQAKNEYETDVTCVVLAQDKFGEWQIDDEKSIYSSAEDVESHIRGLDTLDYQYGFTIRDRYLNYSDTLFLDIKPLYEMLIPKSGYQGIELEGDASHHPSTSLSGLWDGNTIDWPRCYLTESVFPGQHSFTFEIGTLAKVSRVKIWDYPEYYNGRTYYYMECMKKFEIWGRPDAPDLTDGSYDGWTLLGTFEETKPSGLPYGEQNDEDYNTARAGFDYSCDVNAPKVRYIRIKCLENWMGTNYIGVSEIQVYGDPR